MSSFRRKPRLISMFFFPSLYRSWKHLQSNKIQDFVGFFLRVWPCIYRPTELCVNSHCVTPTSHHSRFIVNGGLILSYLLSELITSEQVDLFQPRLVDPELVKVYFLLRRKVKKAPREKHLPVFICCRELWLSGLGSTSLHPFVHWVCFLTFDDLCPTVLLWISLWVILLCKVRPCRTLSRN